MMRNKIFAAIAISSAFVSGAWSLELPDRISEWQSVNEHVTRLIAGKDNQDFGSVTYREYVRESPKGSVQIILTEGSGTGSLYVPERVNDSEGMMPSSSGYRVLEVGGHRAILESYEHMPLSLAVDVSRDVILMIETGALNEPEIIELAEKLIETSTIR